MCLGMFVALGGKLSMFSSSIILKLLTSPCWSCSSSPATQKPTMICSSFENINTSGVTLLSSLVNTAKNFLLSNCFNRPEYSITSTSELLRRNVLKSFGLERQLRGSRTKLASSFFIFQSKVSCPRREGWWVATAMSSSSSSLSSRLPRHRVRRFPDILAKVQHISEFSKLKRLDS